MEHAIGDTARITTGAFKGVVVQITAAWPLERFYEAVALDGRLRWEFFCHESCFESA